MVVFQSRVAVGPGVAVQPRCWDVTQYRHALPQLLSDLIGSASLGIKPPDPSRAGAPLLWNPRSVSLSCLLMAFDDANTLMERFDNARGCLRAASPRRAVIPTSYNGLCDAQVRWTRATMRALAKAVRLNMHRLAGDRWMLHGWVLLGFDGSRFQAPRTRKNERGLGVFGKENASPHMNLCTLWHLNIGLPYDWLIGRATSSERDLMHAMLGDLPEPALIVADIGLGGYEHLSKLNDRGVCFLIRAGSPTRLLKNLEGMGSVHRVGKNRVHLWLANKHSCKPLALRLIKVRDGNNTMFLVTNVMSKNKLSDQHAAKFYRLRWGIEVYHRTLRQTMDNRTVLSRTPRLAKWELSWSVMSIVMLGLMGLPTQIKGHVLPRKRSEANMLRIIRHEMHTPTSRSRMGRVASALGRAMQDEYARAGKKRSRNYPRKKKTTRPRKPIVRAATRSEIKQAKRFFAQTADD
jgi:hypothetical protein